ncbi:MAG: CHRD domain-containing protein [Actinomycetota bacterium]
MRRIVLFLLAASLVMAANPALAGGRPLSTSLTGATEVPGPGDADGSGEADLWLNQGLEEICFNVQVRNIAAATAAHIHRGGVGVAGPVVVGLTMIDGDTFGGCVTVDPVLIKEIRQHPDRFYVNVHNAAFPGGAVRGQLSK